MARHYGQAQRGEVVPGARWTRTFEIKHPARQRVEACADKAMKKIRRAPKDQVVLLIDYRGRGMRLHMAMARTPNGRAYLEADCAEEWCAGVFDGQAKRADIRDALIETIELAVDGKPGWYEADFADRIARLEARKIPLRYIRRHDRWFLFKRGTSVWVASVYNTGEEGQYGACWHDAVMLAKQSNENG